jgi:hypothetical protein
MAKFYQLYLEPKEGVEQELIDKKLNLALDWFRYGKSVYLLYSTASIEKLQVRFMPIVEPTGSLFICEINITPHQGYMDRNFWDWINKERPERAKKTLSLKRSTGSNDSKGSMK